MILNTLKLYNFKNYTTQVADFGGKLNIITGLNGTGKTNLLDAIYYLCSCKSYFQASDKALINFDEKFFILEADFLKQAERYSLSCKYSPRKKKTFECNRYIYERISEHIGQFPVSIITPDDIQIVKAGSEFRRKLVNHTLSQISQRYLNNLIRYNKILQQRNAYLKQIANTKQAVNNGLLDTYDAQLIEFSSIVFALRKEIMPLCTTLLQKSYSQISDGREQIDIDYNSDLKNNDFHKLLLQNRQKDIILRRTTVGIHKDDWVFSINTHPIKKIGSQGQQKSFLIALKLAFYQLVKEKLAIAPILLLDDIFDKLDVNRIGELLKIVSSERYGQIFITDADNKRLPTVLKTLNLQFNHYLVDNGQLQMKTTIDV